MATFIRQQVETFHDAVMREHHEAMKVRDVAEAIRLSATRVEMARDGMANAHWVGDTIDGELHADFQRIIDGLQEAMPTVLTWAVRKRAEGYPIDQADVEQCEAAIPMIGECRSHIVAIAEETAGDPALPSLGELQRMIAESSPDRIERATANATKLFGRPVV